MQAFSSCSGQELLFVAMFGLLIAAASPVAGCGDDPNICTLFSYLYSLFHLSTKVLKPPLPNLPFKANVWEGGLHGCSQHLLEQSCYSLSVWSLVLSFGSAIRSCHLFHGLNFFSFLPPKYFKQKCHGQRWTSTEFGESQIIACMIPDSVFDIPVPTV